MEQLASLPADATPPQMAYRIHRQVRQLTNSSDTYRQAKDDATQQALALYPKLKELVSHSSDPLETVFFLLQAKCSVIAQNLGVDEGSAILKRQKSPLTTHV